METNKPNSQGKASRSSGGLREEVKDFIFDQIETLVEEVGHVAFGLPLPPLHRTALGCMKVLGNRFGGATKSEITLAVLAVQTWITLQKREQDKPKRS